MGFDAALHHGGGREVILALAQHAFGEFTQSKIPRIRGVLRLEEHAELESKFAGYERNDILSESNPEMRGFKGMFCDLAQYLLWKVARGDYGDAVRKQLEILPTSTGDSPDDAEDIYARLMRK